MSVSSTGTYAEPKRIARLDDCGFYHTMELPEYGLVTGEWDLRGNVDRYYGGFDFRGKRVLEIGSASGFLTFYMERQGADVVGYDLSPEHDWDLVPFAQMDHAKLASDRKKLIGKLNNGFWLAHRALGSAAKLAHGSVYSVPEEIGTVDVSVFGSILLHLRDPFQALYQASRLTRETMIVTDRCPHRALRIRIASSQSKPVMYFSPDYRKGRPVDLWWRFDPKMIQAFLGVLGFEEFETSTHKQMYHGKMKRLFTVIGHRVRGSSL
jgi:SAM-dependent methyltransferase